MASGGGRRRPRRRSRAKVRKIKYLSLSRHLTKTVEAQQSLEKAPASESPLPEEEAETPEDGGDGGGQEQQQHGPFPLHPEPSTLFAAAPSLTDILGVSASGGGESSSASPDVSSGTGFPGDEDDLARRALRGRERWVYCSSSPSATTSSSCSSAASTGTSGGSARSLLLKLDYEEILAAWAGRGTLYIGGAADPADLVAPKLELDSVFVEVGPSQHTVAGAWSAPDMSGRAERVRRYKEKRQRRLFAKRIRYEVRRFNAVKRPRLKGRFIKEKEGVLMTDGSESLHSTFFHRHKDGCTCIDPSLCK